MSYIIDYVISPPLIGYIYYLLKVLMNVLTQTSQTVFTLNHNDYLYYLLFSILSLSAYI